MSEENHIICKREREIDRLIDECSQIQKREGAFNIIMEKLLTKVDSIDEKIGNIVIDNMKFESRLTSIERFIFSFKWFLVGGGVIGLLQVFGLWEVVARFLGL